MVCPYPAFSSDPIGHLQGDGQRWVGETVMLGKKTGLGTDVNMVVLGGDGRLAHPWGCPGEARKPNIRTFRKLSISYSRGKRIHAVD